MEEGLGFGSTEEIGRPGEIVLGRGSLPKLDGDLTGGPGLSASGRGWNIPIRNRSWVGRGPFQQLGRFGSPWPFSCFFFFSFLSFFYFLISSITSLNLVQIDSNQFLKISKIQGNKSRQ
jgi:hypothetical protein